MSNGSKSPLCNTANAITSIRIVCSIVLIFCPIPSSLFYLFYIAAGVSDMIDGWIARRTKTASEFGAKLDTLSDIIFVIVCLFKIIPILNMTVWLYLWTGIIACIKIFNYIYGGAVQKQFVSVHSLLNKITGAALFILPLTLSIINLKYSGSFVCTLATVAAIQEGHLIIMNKNQKTK